MLASTSLVQLDSMADSAAENLNHDDNDDIILFEQQFQVNTCRNNTNYQL